MREFSTTEDSKKHLHKICESNSTPRQRVSMFVDQVEKALNRDFPDGNYEAYHEAHTQDDLREWLDPNLREDDDGERPVMWPFVKRVM